MPVEHLSWRSSSSHQNSSSFLIEWKWWILWSMITALSKCFRNTGKLGCMVRMVVDPILPHAECGPNDHRKDASQFTINLKIYFQKYSLFNVFLDWRISFVSEEKYKGPFVRNTSKSNFQTFEKLEKVSKKLNYK